MFYDVIFNFIYITKKVTKVPHPLKEITRFFRICVNPIDSHVKFINPDGSAWREMSSAQLLRRVSSVV